MTIIYHVLQVIGHYEDKHETIIFSSLNEQTILDKIQTLKNDQINFKSDIEKYEHLFEENKPICIRLNYPVKPKGISIPTGCRPGHTEEQMKAIRKQINEQNNKNYSDYNKEYARIVELNDKNYCKHIEQMNKYVEYFIETHSEMHEVTKNNLKMNQGFCNYDDIRYYKTDSELI